MIPQSSASPASARPWQLALLGCAAPLLAALSYALWQMPYPINEIIGVLEDIRVMGLAYLDPAARSWYRPLYYLTWHIAWDGTGSLAAALLIFRLLGLAAVLGLVVLFIAALRPRAAIDWAAGTFAVAVLLGMQGFRANLELPLFMTLFGMPLILIVWMLLEREPRRWHAPAITALMLIAVGYKEQGLVIVPLVVACWWAGSPGATLRTTASVVTAGVIYLAVRLATSGTWAPFEQAIGYGFTTLDPEEAAGRFGGALWQLRAYNVTATVANLLFSEPTDGRFVALERWLAGTMRPWQAIHVLSSAALTVLIGWWGVGVMRSDPRSLDARVFMAAGATVLASGALGFAYTRDRLGGMAVIFLALAAYFAARHAVARAARLGRAPLAAAVALLVALNGAWQIRAIGTLEDVRLRAEKNQREWLTDLAARRREFAHRPEYLAILEAMVAQGRDPAAPRISAYPRPVRDMLGDD